MNWRENLTKFSAYTYAGNLCYMSLLILIKRIIAMCILHNFIIIIYLFTFLTMCVYDLRAYYFKVHLSGWFLTI